MIFSSSKIALTIFAFLILLTSIIMKLSGFSSLGIGISFFVILIFLLYVIHPIKIFIFKNDSIIIFSLFFSFLFSILSLLVNDSFLIARFFASFFLMIFFIYIANILSNYISTISPKKFLILINLIYIILLIDGLAGILLKSQKKSTLLFLEPSHYALSVLAFYLFHLYTEKKLFYKISAMFVLFIIAVFIQNLTLLVGLFFGTLIAIKPKISFLILIFFLIIIISLNIDMSYFINRLVLTENLDNLSVLVFLSGWERSFLNIYNTFGLGVGFNQLGYVGEFGYYQGLLSKSGAERLNLHDGGTTGSKLISEVGIIGVLLLFLYKLYFFKIIYRLKKKFSNFDFKDIFFFCVYIMFFVELYIRGVGYFSGTLFLFLTSIFYLKNITFRKDL